MFDDAFEKSFEQFLQSKEYDLAEEALFAMARKGFIAGWRAAGGHVMSGQRVREAETKYDVLLEKPPRGGIVRFPEPE